MTETASSAEGTGSSSDSAALELFESFLLRYHEGDSSFEDLRRAHPGHTALFQRWWDQLVQSGEVTETPPGAELGDLPEEGGRFGSYKIERELGRGAQGTVFLAEDTRLSRRVALKILPNYRASGRDRSQRFAREAELASRLDHPGLCTVYERGTQGRTAFLAMRFVDGETLSGCVARARRQAEIDGVKRAIRIDVQAIASERVAIDAVLRLFEAVAVALHAAHEASLIHRDIKPGNVVVDRAGHPVILDFGLARDVDSDVLTLTGDLVGTPAYMSPEQLAAHRIELDRRTDVFSLGAALYECLTLSRPFEAPTRNELYQKILAADPRSPRHHNSEISRDLEVVLRTALEKDRNRRYQTAQDFAEELRRVRCHEPIRARPAGPLLRMRRWAQRNPTVAVSTTLVFFALAVGLGVSLFYHSKFQRVRAPFERLADLSTLEVARRKARALQPPWPAQAAAIAAWLEDYGRPLRDRLPAHRAQLEALRARANPYTEEDRARDRAGHPLTAELTRQQDDLETYTLALKAAPHQLLRDSLEYRIEACRNEIVRLTAALQSTHVYAFADRNEQTAHDRLAKLVAELDEFTGPNGVYTRVEAHLAWARTVASATCSSYAKEWRAVQEAVGADQPYGGREIQPQIGLVPLGKDVDSGLQEFAHLRSGKKAVRDPKTHKLGIDGETGIVFVLIPGGKFAMGAGRRVRRDFEWAPHDVELDWYLMSKYELSQGQWKRLAGTAATTSYAVLGGPWGQDHYPVQNVTWREIDVLLREFGLDMPTEAQWEFAALSNRGMLLRSLGTEPFGNFADRTSAELFRPNSRNKPRYRDDYVLTAPIDEFLPNRYGLHNLFGNVAEFCREFFAPIPLNYVRIEKGDGLHLIPSTGYRAIRGGAYDTQVKQLGLSQRAGQLEHVGHPRCGVRSVRAVR